MAQNDPPKTPRPVIILIPSEKKLTGFIADLRMEAALAAAAKHPYYPQTWDRNQTPE